MKMLYARASIGIVALALAGSALARNPVAYMTGLSDPYGLPASDPGSPEHAMQLIYGPGGYDRFQGFDNSIFSVDYSAIYLEGSDVASAEFLATYSAAAAQGYVNRGGRLYVNAAISDWGDRTQFEIAFGVLLKPGQSTFATSVWHTENGAGTDWTGTPFASSVIDDSNAAIWGPQAVIDGQAGPVYSWYFSFSGNYMFVGTLTAPALHSAGGERLRTNLTCLWNGGPEDVCGGVVPPVPEPATWAMMIAGFGLVGAAARRKRAAIA